MQVDAKLSKASFDATVEAKVISVVDKTDGVYLVQIQSAKFEAYSTGGTYYEGDTVYVNVPRNDYTQQKFIVGRKTTVDGDGTSKVFNFRYPFDDFIPLFNLTGNETQTILLRNEERGYHANRAIDGADPMLDIDDVSLDPNLIWRWVLPADGTLIGTTLGIQVDWQTLLGAYQPVSGNYGLRFLILGDWSTPTEDGKNSIQVERDVLKEFYFTTDEMYGNPYAFIDWTTQQMLMDVRRFVKLSEIRAYFWQDHKFYANDNTYIPDEGMSNINLKGLQVFFGESSKDIENEKIYLFTYDDLNYGRDFNSTTPRADLDTRTIHFAWVHRTGENEYTTVNSESTLNQFNLDIDDEDKKAHIYWYHQRKSNDNNTDGELYIAPGTTSVELEEKYNTLKAEMEQVLASYDEETYAGGHEAYIKEYERVKKNYERKLTQLQELQEDAKATEKMRLSTLGGYDYELLPEYTDCFEITRQMDINIYRERYKAVVAWEGTYEISDPIVFQNINSTVSEDLTAARNEVVFRLLRTETYKDEAGNKQIRLVEDNSIGNFYVYDENNQCIKNDEEVFYSDIYYYIQIWIYNYDTETYVPLTTESTNDPIKVTWQYPVSDTMITQFLPIDTSDAVYSSTLIPAGQTAFNSIATTTRKFKINNYWDVRFQDNIITAIINRNGKQYVCQKQLRFGQSGSTGTKYTLRIDLTNPAGYMMIKNLPFQIESTIYDQNGNKLESPLFTFNYELLNDGPCCIGRNVTTVTQPSTWDTLSTNGYTGNSIRGYLQTDQPPVFKVSVNLHDPQYKYNIEDVRGFMAASDSNLSDFYRIGCPDRIEYKSDGTIPIYDASTFEVLSVVDEKLVWPTWFLEQYKKINDTFTLLDNSTHEFLTLNETVSQTSRINTNTEDAESRENSEVAQHDSAYHIEYSLNPYLDNTNQIRDQIAFYWDDAYQTEYATFIGFWLNGAVVYQAIAFAHNVYASSLVNSWDGQLQLDKENNAILTKMLAAGTKDTRNRFTGVMMGDWSSKGDSSIDPIGLYGFSHGAQTFGFKIDGTGFIGPAGRGQIKFDGTRALISDYSQDHYINLNPIHFSISEDGSIATDNGSFSQYFLYSKNKKLNLESTLENYSRAKQFGWINTAWADTFRDDNEYDYFVVDPNNGVYMSGGIIARYGMIGDCLQLSATGLTYQKNNGIIFIGQERRRDGIPVNAEDTSIEYDDVYWDSSESTHFDFSNNGEKPSSRYGRYIFWAGDGNDLNPGVPTQLYPNFGIEHNGVVHLNRAYLQGEVRATSLQISMPDGEYHDVQSRFANTYYADINPANKATDGGICNKAYGDLLIVGDLWYDTSAKVSDFNDITTFGMEQTEGTDLNNTEPAQDSDYAYTISQLTQKTMNGYICYKWTGNPEQGLLDVNGVPKTEVQNRNGWQECPAISKDTLGELSALALQSTVALDTLANNVAKTINKAYDSIRQGMSPISFFEDGNCYVSISAKSTTIDSQYGIGSAPAGIGIYQLDNHNKYNGSCFLLNGQRMGFYKSYTTTVNNQEITYSIPLLAYHDGNMALAGSLLLGLQMNSAGDLTKENLYANIFDGPNAKISLANGQIVLDGKNKKITLGDMTNDSATILLAGYNIKGNTTQNISYSFSSELGSTGTTFGAPTSFTSTSQETGSSVGNTQQTNIDYTTNITFNQYTLTPASKQTISSLNYFSITHEDRGFRLLENYTAPSGGQSQHFSLITPTKTGSGAINGLLDWDLITGKTGTFSTIDTTTMFVKDLYIRTSSSTNSGGVIAYEVATKKWVVDQLAPIVAALASATSGAQGTANRAYGVAKNHSHNGSGIQINFG